MAVRQFKMSDAPAALSVSGRAQWAIDQAAAYRNTPGVTDLYDPAASGEVYSSPRRPWSAGANAKQCVALLDQTGNWTTPVKAKSNVRCVTPAGIKHGLGNQTAFFQGNGATNFSCVGQGTSAPVTLGDYQDRPEWTANRAIWDCRTHLCGSTPSNGRELGKLVAFDGGEAHWTWRFNYAITSNDCWLDSQPRPAGQFKQNKPLMSGAGPNVAAAVKNLLIIDCEYDGQYSGYGPWQFAANTQSLFANIRCNGGTVCRNEPDNGVTNSWGIHDVEYRCIYGEKINRGISCSPADSMQPMDNIYGRDFFIYACAEAIGAHRQNDPGATGGTIASIDLANFYVMGATGAQLQEAQPCQTNPSRNVMAISVTGLINNPPKNVRYNGSFSGGTQSATRDTSFSTQADLLAMWQAARVILGSNPNTSSALLSNQNPVVGTQITASARDFPGTAPHDWTVLWQNSTDGVNWVTATGTGATTPITNTPTGDADAVYTPNANDQGKFLRATLTNTPTAGSGDTATTPASARVANSSSGGGADVPAGVVANFDGQIIGGRVKTIDGASVVTMPVGNNYTPQPGDVLIFFAVNED